MRLKTLAAAATAVITAALGLSVLTAGPATASTAADPRAGVWRSYESDPIGSRWYCRNTATSIGADISGRPCIIHSANGQSVQGAVVILNNRSTVVPVVAAVNVYDFDGKYGEWHCSRSGVGARSWSVCFGETIDPGWYPQTHGGANGVDLGYSPAI
jgi:hypothetical protein